MFLVIETSDPEAIDIIRRNRFVTVDELCRAETLAELCNAIEAKVADDCILRHAALSAEVAQRPATVPFAGILADDAQAEAYDARIAKGLDRLMVDAKNAAPALPPEDEDDEDLEDTTLFLDLHRKQ